MSIRKVVDSGIVHVGIVDGERSPWMVTIF